jgi:endonuclease/exonuclease/phosphatase family metal-dependent hydrolase
VVSAAIGLVLALGAGMAPASAAFPAPTGLHGTSSTFNAIGTAWNAVSGAWGYRIDYATKSDFSNYVHENTRSTTRVLKNGTTGLIPNTTYYLRVMVIDANLVPVSRPSATASYATKPIMKFAVGSYNVKDPDSTSTVILSWAQRCPKIGQDIVKLAIRAVGVQEVYETDDRQQLLSCVNSAAGGQYYAMAPDPSSSSGKDSRIIYDTRTFRLLASGAYAYPTQYFDSTKGKYETSRQLSWAKLQQPATGQTILFTTTHLSPSSDAVDVKQWDQLITEVNRLKGVSPVPQYVVVTGDFNTTKFEAPASTQLSKMRSYGYEDVLGQIYRSYSTYRNPTTRVDAWISTSNRQFRDLSKCGCLVSTDKNSNSIDYVFVSKALKALYYRVYAQPRHGLVMDYLLSDHFMAVAVISQ